MKQQRFQSFIDQLYRASAGGDLADALSGFLENWGIEKFAYLGFPPQGTREPVWLTTYPMEWARHYESKRYETIDPVVATMRSGVMPFFWSDTRFGRDITSEQRKFFGEASEFGIRSGFTVPIHDGQGGIAAVTLASNQKLGALKRATAEDLGRLHLAALYFHVHARQKLEAIIEQDQPHLSPREIACLHWLALGKTMWDVGEILGISRRTVVFHVENAKLKLNAVTLPQAVAQALARRIIEL
jgi:LuxR family transcriptional regulator, activator of conjugal transfer of Ti plasmids